MKTKLITIISILALSIGAFAQSTHPFQSKTGTILDQVADAKTCLTDSVLAADAAHYLLLLKTGSNYSAVEQLALSDSIFADDTMGGLVTGTDKQTMLLETALVARTRNTSSVLDILTIIAAKKSQFSSNTDFSAWCDKATLGTTAQVVMLKVNQKDFGGAIVLGNTSTILGQPADIPVWQDVKAISDAKTALKSTDSLNWAKARYLTSRFSDSQDSINVVIKNLRTVDNGALGRANAFASYQATATGTNVLASITLPTELNVISSGTNPENIANSAIAKVIAGDNAGALRIVNDNFMNAVGNDAITKATELVAQILRDVDGNLVRANAFISAQKAGQSFTIAELQ